MIETLYSNLLNLSTAINFHLTAILNSKLSWVMDHGSWRLCLLFFLSGKVSHNGTILSNSTFFFFSAKVP